MILLLLLNEKRRSAFLPSLKARVSCLRLYETWECERCKQVYCQDCVDSYEVDFEVEDKAEGFNNVIMQWKGWSVCPWCYNQLIDKAFEDAVEKN